MSGVKVLFKRTDFRITVFLLAAILILFVIITPGKVVATNHTPTGPLLLLTIRREAPITQTTSANEVHYLVEFSEIVGQVAKTDFTLSAGTVSGAVITEAVQLSEYVVRVKIVGITNANGLVNLDVAAANNIEDLGGAGLIATDPLGVDENYLIDNVSSRAHKPNTVPDLLASSDSGTLDNDNYTNNTYPDIKLSCSAVDELLILYGNNQLTGTVLATHACGGIGEVIVPVPFIPTDAHIVMVYTSTVNGIESEPSSSVTIFLDVTNPAAPTIVLPITGSTVNGLHPVSGSCGSGPGGAANGHASISSVDTGLVNNPTILPIGPSGNYSGVLAWTYASDGQSKNIVTHCIDLAGNRSDTFEATSNLLIAQTPASFKDVVRKFPNTITTPAVQVEFLVKFTNIVNNVKTTDFILVGPGAIGGIISEVVKVVEGTYKVKVTGLGPSSGTLTLAAASTNSIDTNGNGLILTQLTPTGLSEFFTLLDNTPIVITLPMDPAAGGPIGNNITLKAASCGIGFANGTIEITTLPAGMISPYPFITQTDIVGNYGDHSLDVSVATEEFTVMRNCISTSGFRSETAVSANSYIPDQDQDSVVNIVEAASPNNGDANNDGVIDQTQSTVASFPGVTTQSPNYISLEVDGNNCATFTNAITRLEGIGIEDDLAYNYPLGLIEFTLEGCSVGGTQTITAYFYSTLDAATLKLRKYNTVLNTYSDINAISITNETIAGLSVIKTVHTVTDGGANDQDGVANGIIIDPFGLTTTVAEILPETGIGVVGVVSAGASIVFTATLAVSIRPKKNQLESAMT